MQEPAYDEGPTPKWLYGTRGEKTARLRVTAGDIDSLSAVDLTIDGYTYSLGEIGFENSIDGGIRVGGILSGVTGVGTGPDDLYLRWEFGVPASTFFAFSDAATFLTTRTAYRSPVRPHCRWQLCTRLEML